MDRSCRKGPQDQLPDQVIKQRSVTQDTRCRENFATWLPPGAILRGWARGALGDPAEGLSWIEDGIRDFRATGAICRRCSHLREATFFQTTRMRTRDKGRRR